MAEKNILLPFYKRGPAMHPDIISIIKGIRHLIKYRKDLSQRAIAKAANLSQGYLSQVLSLDVRKNFTISVLSDLLTTCNISLEEALNLGRRVELGEEENTKDTVYPEIAINQLKGFQKAYAEIEEELMTNPSPTNQRVQTLEKQMHTIYGQMQNMVKIMEQVFGPDISNAFQDNTEKKSSPLDGPEESINQKVG